MNEIRQQGLPEPQPLAAMVHAEIVVDRLDFNLKHSSEPRSYRSNSTESFLQTDGETCLCSGVFFLFVWSVEEVAH
jgi:hypothetical protein